MPTTSRSRTSPSRDSGRRPASSRPARRTPSYDTSDFERTSGAFGAVGSSLGSLFIGAARGVGGLARHLSVRDDGTDLTDDLDLVDDADDAPRPARGRKKRRRTDSADRADRADSADRAAGDAVPTTVMDRAAANSSRATTKSGGRRGGKDDPAGDAGRDDRDDRDIVDAVEPVDRLPVGGGYDGPALIVFALALVTAATLWFGIGGTVGDGLAFALTWLIGAGALVVPVVLVAVGWVLMVGIRTTQHSHLRLGIGIALIAVAVLALFHVFAGQPGDTDGRARAGGIIGTLIGGPAAVGFSPYLAVPLLLLVIVYGGLQLTGMTVRELGRALSSWLGFAGRGRMSYGRDDRDYRDGADAPYTTSDQVDGHDDPMELSDYPAHRPPGRGRRAAVRDVRTVLQRLRGAPKLLSPRGRPWTTTRWTSTAPCRSLRRTLRLPRTLQKQIPSTPWNRGMSRWPPRTANTRPSASMSRTTRITGRTTTSTSICSTTLLRTPRLLRRP